MSSTTADSGPALKLTCPVCRGALERDQSLRCLSCDRVWPEREGIPSFLDSDFYWGEIPRAEMREILRAIQEKGWEEVVHQELPRRYPHRYRYVFHPIRGDWFYLGDIARRQAALDLGAGWGGLSLRLSRLFEEVVAVEGVWERIQFASLLFAREGADNVTPIHADIHALPLPLESFDLVVMSGVLEWAALGGEEADPEQSQRSLLAKAWELLRPGGSLYIGIENRFALIFLLGGRDHGQPRWMGVLPRPLARWYGGLRGVPQRHALTHSSSGYRRLLEAAGFEDIRFHTAFPSYSYPRVLIPLSHPALLAWAAKKSSDWRTDSLSLTSKLAHRLVSLPVVAHLAYPRAESLAVWARRREGGGRREVLALKGARVAADCERERSDDSCAGRGPLMKQVIEQIRGRWGEFGLALSAPARVSALQLSSNWEVGGKVTWFFCVNDAPEPILVARVSRALTDSERITNEHKALLHLRRLTEGVARHVPRALALWKANDHLVGIQEYVSGRDAFRVRAKGLAPGVAFGVLRRCVSFLTELARETHREVASGKEHPYLTSLLGRAALLAKSSDCSSGARELLERLGMVAGRAQGSGVPTVAHHGDLNTFDILASRDQFWITDWEWFTFTGLPFLDLVTLGILAADRINKGACPPAVWRKGHAISAAMRALIGVGGDSSHAIGRNAGEAASSYCAALALSDAMRPALAAGALLHCFVKESEAMYEGKRYLDPLESNAWVIAARALLEACDAGGGEAAL